MKKIILVAAICVITALAGHAQKFAMVDMEYILKNVPAYEMANEQLNQLSLRWQKELEKLPTMLRLHTRTTRTRRCF